MNSSSPRSRSLAFAALPVAVFAMAWVLRPFVTECVWTVCLLRTATGKPCALCGLTRAFACAAHGDLSAASHFHPLWWLFAVAIIGAGVLAFSDAITGAQRLPGLLKVTRLMFWPGVVLLILLSLARWLALAYLLARRSDLRFSRARLAGTEVIFSPTITRRAVPCAPACEGSLRVRLP